MAAVLPFGRVVRERRRALDLTQDELARRVGCAAVTIRKIEAGDMRASQQVAERLAAALGVPPDERAAFVRDARSVVPEPRGSAPTPRTPPLAPDEIGVADLSGRAIRGYQLGERLGMGGFGAVYRAVQPLVERDVAVKIILPQYADHPDFIRRFEAEAQLVARLEHPTIVPLYDYWREPGVAYLVMRYLRGGTLHALLRQGPPPLQTAVRLVEQIGAALHVAHRSGVIHRDLKPANVLLDEDQNAYVADFGIAKDVARPVGEQSLAGAFIGSPAYSSPEQIRAEPVTPQTDIYALGVLLYELLTGQRPFEGPTPGAYFQQHLTATIPPLAERRPGLPAPLDRVIQRATAKVPSARYPDVRELIADVQTLVGEPTLAAPAPRPTALSPAPPTRILDLTDADNPYKGLRPFDEADAADFFGREALLQQLLARLGESSELARFLAVIGPSGSGKSSAVRAGLVPALRAGALPGSELWYMVDLLPGAQPLHQLAVALQRVATAGVSVEDLLTLLRADQRGLLRVARLVLPPSEGELVLVIDQFEELFTIAADEAARAHLLDSIVTAVLDERSRVRVIVTLRADFIDRPLQYVDFGELVKQRGELVLPLTAEELERAVTGPARRAGLVLEEGLAASIITDAVGQPGLLPLLQHALSELFAGREGRTLTRAAYATVGGVTGALARSAEAIYAGLSDEARATARELFLRLITPGEGAEDTRRRARYSELAAAGSSPVVTSVIEAFGQARLLTFDHDPARREPTVEVAHEALLREWPRLRGWIDGAREALRTQRRLAQASVEWAAAGEDPSFFATGARLAQFAALADDGVVRLAEGEQAYLEASLAARDAQERAERERAERELEAARRLAAAEGARAEQQQRAASQLRWRAVALAVALVAALALAGAAAYFGLAAQEASRVATSRELAAAAVSNLDVDPERSILLALHGLDTARTRQAGDALQRAVVASRVKLVIPPAPDSTTAFAFILFSADSKRVATSPLNPAGGTVTSIRDVGDGRVRYTIPGFASATHWPEGRRLVTEYPEGEQLALTTWETGPDAARATAVITLPLRFADFFLYDLSPDYALIALTRRDGTLDIYRMAEGEQLASVGGAELPFFNLAFSDDGRRLAAGTTDGRIIVWELGAGEPGSDTLTLRPVAGTGVRPLTGHQGEVSFVEFSPDGTRLASAGQDGTARIWDLTLDDPDLLRGLPPEVEPRLRVTLRGHTNSVQTLAWSPDGARLATASRDRQVIIWDAEAGARLFELAGHTGSLFLIRYSPDGTLLSSGSEDGTFRLWDVTPAHELRAFRVSEATNTNYWLPLALSGDGARLMTTNPATAGEPTIFDMATGAPIATLPTGDGCNAGAALSADGKRAATASCGGDEPDSDGYAVAVWDTESGALVRRFPYTTGFYAAALSPDGALVAATGDDATIHLWDMASGAERPLSTPDPGVDQWAVAFSPDGRRLAAGASVPNSQDSFVDVWDSADGRHVMRLEGHKAMVFGLAFSPDGARLASAGRDGTAKLWDAASGDLLKTFEGHTSTVMDVTWSPDGSQIATAAYDATVRVWDVATGEELRTISSPSPASAVAYSPDGAQLFVLSVDGVARVYLLDLDDLIALARTRVTRTLTTEECQTYLHSACPPEAAAGN